MKTKTESGASLSVGVLPCKEVFALKNALIKELAGAGFEMKSLNKDLDVASLAPALFAVDSSESVNRAMFDCLLRCKYNGEKITPETFDEVTARGDYYEIITEVLKVNILPFYTSLFSKFKGISSMLNAAPESL